MALYYNNDGTISSTIINSIINGVVTTSNETIPNIVDSVKAQSDSLIISASVASGKTITEAYAIAHPAISSSNLNFKNKTYLSSFTYGPPTGSVSMESASMAKYPSRTQANFSSSYITPLTIPGDTTLESIIDSRVLTDVDLVGGTLSPNFKTITATQFGTTYSNGTVLVVGDDTWIKDSNLANGFNVVGQQQQYRGFFKFGSGSNTPIIGHNGNNATLPLPGDNTYAYTGSMIVSASKLMFYNGSSTGTNGWTAII